MSNKSIEDLSKLESELGTDFIAWKSQISRLMRDNEKYKQENHSLQCKLEVSSTMQQEMREVQEVMERTAVELEKMNDKKIHELEEKHVEEKKDLFSRLSEMEAENTSKSEEVEKLQMKIQELSKQLQSKNNEIPVIMEEDSALQDEITELVAQLLQRDHVIQQVEESLQDVNNENAELKEILKGTKQELCEKNEQLENTRDELMGLKMELAEVKEKPASESSRGNSLFAEVEDRRKKMLDQMSAMRRGYHEAKRVVSIKDAEIRSLKAERSALIRKWEDDKVDSHYRDNKLLETYKGRISELELKLQAHKDKYNDLESQKRPTDNTFSFFQSMIDSKKKEIEELESKLENVSIQAVLEEEMKHKLSRQMRYWRCKAMSSDAQLIAIKSHLEAGPHSSNSEVLRILHQPGEKQQLDLEETLDSTQPPPDVIEESVITLEQLMRVPNSLNKSLANDNSMFDSSSEDFGDSVPRVEASIVKRESVIPNIENRNVKKVPTILANDTGERSNIGFKREVGELEFDDDSSIQIMVPKERGSDGSNKENTAGNERENLPKLKPALVQENFKFLAPSVEAKKEKKTLKFTEDTVDPPPRTLRRQLTPKYPIVFVANKSKKP